MGRNKEEGKRKKTTINKNKTKASDAKKPLKSTLILTPG